MGTLVRKEAQIPYAWLGENNDLHTTDIDTL